MTQNFNDHMKSATAYKRETQNSAWGYFAHFVYHFIDLIHTIFLIVLLF